MEWRPEIASYAVHGKWLPGSKRALHLYATAEHSDGQPIDHGLCAAVAEGDLEAIDAAIGKGASINDPHKATGHVPMMIAALHGRIAALNRLLLYEAWVADDIQDHIQDHMFEEAPVASQRALRLLPMLAGDFHRACWVGDLAEMETIITARGPGIVNRPNANGVPPLSVACASGRMDVVTRLGAAFKDLLDRDHGNDDPIAQASQHQAFLNQKIPQGKQPWFANGWSPIHECCAWGNTDAAHWLVANGADAGRADNFQLSPLHTASFHGHVDMIQALVVDFRADVNCVDRDGDTPLHMACAMGELAVVKFLVACGSNPNCANTRDGHTPLHESCYNGQLETARYLVKEQAVDPNCVDDDGHTPFHEACFNGNLETAKFLVSECVGIQPNLPDVEGVTPFMYACRNGHIDTAKYLVAECKVVPSLANNGATPLHESCLGGHIDVAKWLLAEFSDIVLADPVALHLACFASHLALLSFLVAHFKQRQHCVTHAINTTTRLRDVEKNALGHALESGHPAILRLLLDHGAECDQRHAPSDQPAVDAARAFGRVDTWTADEIVTHWGWLFWSPATHRYQPARLREAVRTTLSVATRRVNGRDYPREVWRGILRHLIGSDWGTPALAQA